MRPAYKTALLFGSAGLLVGLPVGWFARSAHHEGPWEAQESEDTLRVYLKGEPVGLFKYQHDHFKFAVTGTRTPAHKAIVGGSVDSDRLIFLEWEAMGTEGSKRWLWYDEDQKVTERSYLYSERPQIAFPDLLLE